MTTNQTIYERLYRRHFLKFCRYCTCLFFENKATELVDVHRKYNIYYIYVSMTKTDTEEEFKTKIENKDNDSDVQSKADSDEDGDSENRHWKGSPQKKTFCVFLMMDPQNPAHATSGYNAQNFFQGIPFCTTFGAFWKIEKNDKLKLKMKKKRT